MFIMQIDWLRSTFYQLHIFKLKYFLNLSKYQTKIYSKTRLIVKLNYERFSAKFVGNRQKDESQNVLQENKVR